MSEVNIDDLIKRNIRQAVEACLSPGSRVLAMHKNAADRYARWFVAVVENGNARSVQMNLSHKWAWPEEIRKALYQ